MFLATLTTSIAALLLLTTVSLTVSHIKKNCQWEASSEKSYLCDLSVLICSGTFLFSQSSIAGEFLIGDSLQYCWGALGLATKGNFLIPLAGTELPPRFSPWFSQFLIAPVYLFTDTLSWAIISIVLSSLLCLWLTLQLGCLIHSKSGGIFACLILFLMSGFRYYSANIMTEIPTTALLLLLLAIWNSSRKDEIPLLTGLLIFFAAAFRPPMLALLVPFLWQHRKDLQKTLLLVTPAAVLILGSLTYNYGVTGTVFRSGYHYWVSVPYDYPSLTFSFTYLQDSLPSASRLFQLAFFSLIIPFIIKIQKKNGKVSGFKLDIFKQSVFFLLLSGLPQVIFYSFYFYNTERFFLPLEFALLAISAPVFANFIRITAFKASAVYALTVVALFSFSGFPDLKNQQAIKVLAQRIKKEGQIVVSSRDPLQLKALLPRDKAYLFLPFSRRVEFASKIITPEKIEANRSDLPSDPFNHRAPFLLESPRAVDPFPVVASEVTHYLFERADLVIMDTESFSNRDLRAIEESKELKQLYIGAL